MSKIESSTTLGYENELWTAADKLRGSMDAGEYKHVVLGLIFLKYVSERSICNVAQPEAKSKSLPKMSVSD